jgi:hypothetical protein
VLLLLHEVVQRRNDMEVVVELVVAVPVGEVFEV